MSLTRRIGLTGLATALAVIAAGLHHRYRPEAAERIDLHGTWRIVSRGSGGRHEPVSPGETVAIDCVAMTFTFVNTRGPNSEAPFRLNARAKPRHINIRFPLAAGAVPANGRDGVTRAVYQREGSILRLAWYSNDVDNPNPNGRPAQFPAATVAYAFRLELAR
jgi:uncharacterized protein (TIGR03067 family)